MISKVAGGLGIGKSHNQQQQKQLEIGGRLLDLSKERGFNLEIQDVAELVEVDPDNLASYQGSKEDHPDVCLAFEYALVFDVAPDDYKAPEEAPERIEIKVHPLEYDLYELKVDKDRANHVIDEAQKKKKAAEKSGQTARINPKLCEVEKRLWFSMETQRMIEAIHKVGFKTRVYRSWDLKSIVVLVGVGEYTLRQMAAYRQTDLEIDPVPSVMYARERNFQLALFTDLGDGDDGGARTEDLARDMETAGAVDGEDEDFIHKIGCLGLCCGHPTGHVYAQQLPLDNWKHMYVQFRHDAPQAIYKHYPQPGTNDETIFDTKTRLRLIYEGLIADDDDRGCEFTFEDYLVNANHPLRAVFPLEHPEERERLETVWVKNITPWELLWVPLPSVRQYLGEGPAFYFAFLRYYTLWLFVPGVLGPIFGSVQLALNRFGYPGIEILSLAVIFWSVAFVDFWKRYESRLRLEWGMTKYEQKAVARPQFKGDYFINSVTGEFEETFQTIYLILRQTFTVSVAMTLLLVALGCVFGVLFVRDTNPQNFALGIGMGVVNGVQISIFDYVYAYMSLYLNDFENHRTQQDYENAKIGKAFFFRFINSFNSLFYISYIQNQVTTQPKTQKQIMAVLRLQLITLMVTAIIIQNCIEVLFPLAWSAIMDKLQERANEELPDGADAEPNITPAEEQSNKLPYEDTLQDMSEMVIQYGYVTLFVVAFPFTPTLAILNNVVEMKVDASNLIQGVQRPHLRGSPGLGVWNIILEVVGIVAVINNVALYTFLTRQGVTVSGGVYHDETVYLPCSSGTTTQKAACLILNQSVPKQLATPSQILFFVIISVILVLIAVAEKVLINDVPDDVEKGIERQRVIENVLVLRARMGVNEASTEMMEDGKTESQEQGDAAFSKRIILGDLPRYDAVMNQ